MLVLFWRQNAGRRRELRSHNLSTDGAGRDIYLRVVADAFALSHIGARHDVKLSVCFAEPDWSRNAHAGLAKSGQRYIFLTMNRGGNLACHGSIVEGAERNFAPEKNLSCQRWFGTDCSDPAICVTSLNMRKWMRERLQRRKKKTGEPESQPAPPPLQPAYFDADESTKPEPEMSHDEPAESPASERESHAEPSAEEAAPGKDVQKSSPRGTGAAGQRGRRRRGGRGRGGRGREQAVAQAFTPKGILAEAGTDAAEVAEPEVAEPEATVGSAAESESRGAATAPRAPAVPGATPSAPARPPKGIVVLAIGLPGSGKSSWFKRHNIVPLSSDMVRSLLFDDVREQRFQDLVFSNLRSMLKARLIAKRPMNYVDATNLTPQERQHWIKLAKDYNYEVHAVFFDVPLEVCVERHQRRDRVVPEDIMRRMAAKLKPPVFPEGFAKITVVRVKKKEQEPEQTEA